MGPTASGKTQLAIELVQRFPFEIISVDSAMVYRGMDIGTAKPTADILRIAPHHLIDICDPAEAYSAAQFCHDASRAIENILARNKIPLLVGGTMLYFRALQRGLAEMPSADSTLRAELTREGTEKGWGYLHQQLAQVDPDAAKRIHPNDSQRIQRALEVYRLTGKSLTLWQQGHHQVLEHQFHNIAIAPQDRAILHARIDYRFTKMLEMGLIEEVQKLLLRGDLDLTMPSLRSVGYRQVWEYLQGKLTYAEMRDKGIFATRQFAKRQLTWLRHWPDLTWFDSEAKDLFGQVLRKQNEI